MATLGDLKTRVITELEREDLEDTLADTLTQHITSAIEFFADEKFWFNDVVVTVPTVANQSTVEVSGVRIVDESGVFLVDSLTSLPKFSLEDIEATDDNVTGWPQGYAYYNDELRLWPIPDAVYSLRITGMAENAAPPSDSDSNVWTNQAYDLITARTKMTLARDQFRDPDGVQLFGAATAEAFQRLMRETAKRTKRSLRCQPDTPGLRNRYGRFRDGFSAW